MLGLFYADRNSRFPRALSWWHFNRKGILAMVFLYQPYLRLCNHLSYLMVLCKVSSFFALA